jgi:hypothetical protein
VADRRSALQDERVLALTEKFVCAADEVWRLQRGSDPDCLAFQSLSTGGKRITDRGTRQGFWVFAPGAGVLARVNTRNPERVLEALDKGLAAWDDLSDEQRALPKDLNLTAGHRWEDNYPDGGLALERIGRELGAKGLASERSRFWNPDYAWFTKEEMTSLFPEDSKQGDVLDWSSLAHRLARFHLIDNVRGQSLPFAASEIEVARLSATVMLPGNPIIVEFHGETRAVADDTWRMSESSIWKPRKAIAHGMECEFSGLASYDWKKGEFQQIDLLAVGRRWGHTVNNGRWRDPAPGRVAFHFALAPDMPRIAPTFLSEYDVDWVVAPEVMPWRDSPAECGLEDE